MTERLYHLIHEITAPLYTSVFVSPYFFIDYWSIVHLLTGFFIVGCALALKRRHPFLILGFLLVLWEALEMAFIYAAIRIFNSESIPDQITDILVGYLGGYIGRLLFQSERKGAEHPL